MSHNFRSIFSRALSFAAGVAIACTTTFPLRAGDAVAEICSGQPAVGLPAWVRNQVIYEVNVRQYSKQGNFAAVEADIPRLRDLGVGVLWFMPIHPIGEVNRKGPLGSYYAVRDYDAVNPDFGTDADFRRLVEAAHAAGLRVVLDWVGNHTAWDHPYTKTHPEYYMHGPDGKFIPPLGFDWTDVIQLDFNNPAVLDFQSASMTRWVRDFGVDGFRCDFATGVPNPFWEKLATRLRAVRPDIFLLAESELPQHQLRAFNASYAFTMSHGLEDIAQGRAAASHIDDLLAREAVLFPRGGALLYYTSNHDENSWAGTVEERFGGGGRVFAVATFMLDGVPLIYNGEEAGLDKRLEFFERDPIEWRAHPMAELYRKLCVLKKSHPALRFGTGARRIATTKNQSIYALAREAGGRRLVCFLNLTAKDVKADAADASLAGKWRDVFTGETLTWKQHVALELRAWSWRVVESAE